MKQYLHKGFHIEKLGKGHYHISDARSAYWFAKSKTLAEARTIINNKLKEE